MSCRFNLDIYDVILSWMIYCLLLCFCFFFFFSSRRRHTRFDCDWSSDVCSSDLRGLGLGLGLGAGPGAGPGPGGGHRLRVGLDFGGGLHIRGRGGLARGPAPGRSEERRVGEEGRSRWSPYHLKKKKKKKEMCGTS